MVSENLAKVRERIALACQKAGRDPTEVKIEAAAKNQPAELIGEAAEAGINIIGENRVQEAEEKYMKIERGDIEWHMIGHLQRNKVKKALDIFSMIESVDSPRLAKEIQKRSAGRDQVTPCLIEVNTSGEESKYGVGPDNLAPLVEKILDYGNIKFLGLMTIAPLTPDTDRVRRSFALLRELRERTENVFNCYLPYLSMGMTDDFDIAVEEGSTLVRLGRVLFGERGGGTA